MKFAEIARKALKFSISKKWLILLKLAIAGLLLFMLVRTISLENIRNALNHANFLFIALAGVLLIPNFMVQGWKWHYLLKMGMPKATYWDALRSVLSGFALGFITPGRVGELSRALFIKGCNRMQVTGLTLVDKLFSMSTIYATGSVATFLFFSLKLDSKFQTPVAILALITVSFAIFLALFPHRIRHVIDWLRKKLPFEEKIDWLLSGLRTYRRGQALRLLAMNFLYFLIFGTQFLLLINAFEPFPIIDGYLLVASTIFAKSLLPISFGDLGVRETAAVYFVSQVGGQQSTAFNAAILMFLINIVLPSLIGLALVLGRNSRETEAATDETN